MSTNVCVSVGYDVKTFNTEIFPEKWRERDSINIYIKYTYDLLLGGGQLTKHKNPK